jgi:hypothetical protein
MWKPDHEGESGDGSEDGCEFLRDRGFGHQSEHNSNDGGEPIHRICLPNENVEIASCNSTEYQFVIWESQQKRSGHSRPSRAFLENAINMRQVSPEAPLRQADYAAGKRRV